MTWTQRIAGLFNRGITEPPNPGRYTYWPNLWDANGKFFGAQEALQLSVVWACVSVISRSVGTCDWKVYERKAGRLEYLEDDALDYILNVRPNPEMTALALKEALISSAAVWGNGYAEIVRDNAGRVKELWPLAPEMVEPIRVNDQAEQVLTGGELAYKVSQVNGGQVILRQAQVYHLRGPSLSGLLGENIVNRAAKSLVLSSAADEFATAYYRNNTVVGGVLEYPKTLDDKSFTRLKNDWVEKRSGPGQAHRPVILENGMTWKPLGDSSAANSQMLEARKFQVEEICRWFGVPLYMVGSLAASAGYGTNLEQTGLEFQRSCLGPWARRMEQEADWKFFPMRGPTSKKQTRIDLTPLSRGDAKTRAEGYAVLRRIGVLSANDILRLEGYNALPGEEGELRLVEASMVSYEELKLREEKAEKDLTAPPPRPFGAPAGPPAEGEDMEDPETEDATTTKPGADAGTED